MRLRFRNYVFDECVRLHKVQHTRLLLCVVKLPPSFLKSFTGIDIFISLSKRNLVSLIYIKAFPFLNNFICKFVRFLFTQNLFFEGFSIFAPTLLRILGELIRYKSFIVSCINPWVIVLQEKASYFLVLAQDCHEFLILFLLLFILIIFPHEVVHARYIKIVGALL